MSPRKFWTTCCLAAAAIAATASPAQASLVDRGNGMIYDTVSNLTWLKNADSQGLMTWDVAVSWADQLSHGGFSDWRLPGVSPVNGLSLNLAYSEDGSTDGGINQTGLNSELGHLFYTSLGNQAATGVTQSGPFEALQNYVYWTGTESPYDPEEALHFFTIFGEQGSSLKVNEYHAMAVRVGDVPEPATLMLLLLGLGAVALTSRRGKTGEQA